MIVRAIGLGGVLLVAMLMPLWIVVLSMVAYATRYRALELVPLMVLVDGYYGVLDSGPHLTLAAIGVVIAAALLKPYIKLYTQ